ncbi:Protein argonaute 6 isoform B [Glycine soja]|uniref:Protein argonaute 6 isoform A n=1 Tax=Glycine soja TaxID=3848 RepID=A0A445JF25_GLYSO|nr:Protein argonaute 6 isoform A [Glycine soja]RZB97045.1 Protein argonaute 6 isoform B [Glycine soja]
MYASTYSPFTLVLFLCTLLLKPWSPLLGHWDIILVNRSSILRWLQPNYLDVGSLDFHDIYKNSEPYRLCGVYLYYQIWNASIGMQWNQDLSWNQITRPISSNKVADDNMTTFCDTSYISRELIRCGMSKGINIERPYTLIEEEPQLRKSNPVAWVERMFDLLASKLNREPKLILCVLP